MSRLWVFTLFLGLAVASHGQSIEGRASLEGVFQLKGGPTPETFWQTYQNYAQDTSPMATIDLGLKQPGRWDLQLTVVGKQQFSPWQPTNLTLPTNGPRTVPLEFHILEAGWLRYNFDPLVVTFGRQKYHLGPSGPSLIVSEAVPFLDGVTFRLPMGEWTLDYATTSPETRRNREHDFTVPAVYNIHRIQWSRDGLTLAFTEQMLLDRNTYNADGSLKRAGTYVLTDYLPVGLFHQSDIFPFNTSMIVDAEWAPGNGWRVWGQLGSDEFDGRDFGIPDTNNPTSNSFLVGVEWEDGPWQLWLDAGTTHYLWGNYDDDKPAAKAIYRVFLDNGVQELFLTSPYGPGTWWLKGKIHWDSKPWSWGLSTEVWRTLDGLDLAYPYLGSEPSNDRARWNSRIVGTVGWKVDSLQITTGPTLLVRNTSVIPQWRVEVRTWTGLKP